jgi:hypothetical protein
VKETPLGAAKTLTLPSVKNAVAGAFDRFLPMRGICPHLIRADDAVQFVEISEGA